MNEPLNPKDVVFFWGGIYSQWHRARIKIDGMYFHTCEHWMIYNKAKFFNDQEALAEIAKTKDPGRHKSIGRKVKNFDRDKWNTISRLVVYRGNLAKFTQHRDLMEELSLTEGQLIVEASPTDSVWGIGMEKDDPDALYPSRWRGTNWLGEAIMQVRSDIKTLSPRYDLS